MNWPKRKENDLKRIKIEIKIQGNIVTVVTVSDRTNKHMHVVNEPK